MLATLTAYANLVLCFPFILNSIKINGICVCYICLCSSTKSNVYINYEHYYVYKHNYFKKIFCLKFTKIKLKMFAKALNYTLILNQYISHTILK